MAVNASSLRLSGLNSGLDTEAIVDAMTAATKLKITNNQKKVLKLEAQQEAYQDIISAMSDFKDKYFNISNLGTTYLKSPTVFNSYDAKSDKDIFGVSITSGSDAVAGDYEFIINSVASQAKYTSSKNSASDLDLSKYVDTNVDDGNYKEYAMQITVGDKTQVIKFNGGADKDEVMTNMNDALKDAFGLSNSGAGQVSVDNNGKISALDKRSITTKSPMELMDSISLTTDFENGKHSLVVTNGDQAVPVSFKLISKEALDIFERDDSGNVKLDDNGNVIFKDTSKYTTAEKIAFAEAKNDFNTVVQSKYDELLATEYDKWTEVNGDADAWLKNDYDLLTDDQKKLIVQHAKNLNQQNAESLYNEALASAYATAKENDEVPDSPDTEKTMGMEEWALSKGYSVEALMAGEYEDDEIFGEAHKDYQVRYNEVDPDGEKFKDDMDFLLSLTTEKQVFRTTYEDNVGLTGVTNVNKNALTAEAANNIEELVDTYNENTLQQVVESVKFDDGTKLNIDIQGSTKNGDLSYTITGEDKDGNAVQIGAISEGGSNFGLDESVVTANALSTSTKLSDLGTGLSSFDISLNGVDFHFSENATIKDVMNSINTSKAGVKLSYSTLDGTFSLTSNEYGKDAKIEFSDNISEEDIDNGAVGFLTKLGFNSGENYTEGKNMSLSVNGQDVETSSSSFTVDGTTIKVTGKVEAGTVINTSVSRNTEKAKELITQFVNDYNELIKKVYGYVDEKPNKDYDFLTDDEKTEMGLSEKQEEMWDTAAKKGILYRDSTLTGIMSKFRMALYSTVESADGSKFGIFNMGISTSGTLSDNGKLTIKEAELDYALENHIDSVCQLFTQTANEETGQKGGIMSQFDDLLKSAIHSTGGREDYGVLVGRAGLASGNSSTNNWIFDQIKSLNSTITNLESRYSKQQDRYWNIFSALETQMGDLNQQNTYMSNMLGG